MHYGAHQVVWSNARRSRSGIPVPYFYVLCAVTGRPLLRDNGLPIIVGVAEGAYVKEWTQGIWTMRPLTEPIDKAH